MSCSCLMIIDSRQRELVLHFLLLTSYILLFTLHSFLLRDDNQLRIPHHS
jgi:hypothetical protein